MSLSLNNLLRGVTKSSKRAPAPAVNELHGSYRLRFATSPADLEAVQRLRFDVFNVELGEGLDESFATKLDRDVFDDVCQHVLVVDERTQRVVGTYRLQTREVAEAGAGFYAETEYNIGPIEEMLDDAVEAGRACVSRDHRHRSVLHLLWRGLAAYALWHRKYLFFGCSSLTSQDVQEGATADAWFQRGGFWHSKWRATALESHACRATRPIEQDEVDAFRPPKLFDTYLRHGSKIVSEPAIDRFFGTIDFLTAADLTRLDARLLKTITSGLPR